MSNFVQVATLRTPPLIEQKFSVRSMVPCDNSRLFRITSGVVRTLTYLEDGSPLVMGVWGAGDTVGGLLSYLKPFYVECFTTVEGVLLDPEDANSVTTLMGHHLKQIEELMLIRSHKTIDVKLVRLLSWLSHRFGGEQDYGQLIDLRITHQDLADLLGTTRVTITRTLGQLANQGVVQRLPLGRIVLREADVWYYEI